MKTKVKKDNVGLLIFVVSIVFSMAALNMPVIKDVADAAYEQKEIIPVETTPERAIEVKEVRDYVDVPVSNPVVSVEDTKTSSTFTITAYCGENYPHICNDGDASKTATGTTPTSGRTIAVDPRVIPYGTQVIIDGHTYIAEDCGGAIKGNRIDIFFNTHEEALAWGRQTKEVTIIY